MKQGFGWLLLAMLPVGAQPLRLTEIQLIGSHNSYHAGISPNEMAFLRKMNPKAADSLDYTHPSLTTQLNDGVRQLELDVFADVKGGRFANPAHPRMAAKAGFPADPPYEFAAAMLKPGFKVLHVQDLDYRSNCQPFTGCLEEIRTWSKAHPGHLPIFLLIENKHDTPRPEYMVKPEEMTAAMFDALDAEIRSVFRAEELITPDVVRGSFPTLDRAVLEKGWPSLESSRGKFVFLLDQEVATPIYTQGHPALEGRVLFTNAKAGTPDAAFIKMNDPRSPQIAELVRKGYLVRTMTDSGPEGVRTNDTRRRDAALGSGAQLLSTDYPYVEKAPGSGYHVEFPSGVIARCNPVVPVRETGRCSAEALLEKQRR